MPTRRNVRVKIEKEIRKFKNKKIIRKNANSEEVISVSGRRISKEGREKRGQISKDRFNAVNRKFAVSKRKGKEPSKIAGCRISGEYSKIAVNKSSGSVRNEIGEIRSNVGRNKIAVSRSKDSEPNNSVGGRKINAVNKKLNKIAVNASGRDKFGLTSDKDKSVAPNSKDKSAVVRLSSKDKLPTDVIRFITVNSRNDYSRNAGNIINSREIASEESKKRAGGSYSVKDVLPNIVINSVISNNCAATNWLCKERDTTTI